MVRLNSLQLFAVPVVTAAGNLILSPPTGPYNVGQTPYVFNCNSPNDPFFPNNVTTSLLVNLYYPTKAVASPVYYIWDGFSKQYDAYFNATPGFFRNMTANLAFNAPPLPDAECEDLKYPTLIFNPPGGGPSTRMFTGLLSELASHGYTIITVDHPYEQPYLEYPDGRTFEGVLPLSWDGETYLQEIYRYRLTDNSAVLDALPSISSDTGIPLNQTHFVFFGHSVGGSSSLNEVLVERNRPESKGKAFLGAIDLDGDVTGPAAANDSSADLHTPTLVMKSSGWPRDQGSPFPLLESLQTSWIKELRVLGNSNHTDYTDTIFLKQALGVSGGEGAIQAPRMLEVVRTFIKAFMDMVSGLSNGEGVLSGDATVVQNYPEVLFEWNNTGDPCAPNLC